MSQDARFDIVVKQGLVLAQPFAPMYKDTTTNTMVTKDYTGYTATFNLYTAPATLESLHGTPPILTLDNTSGAIELGLFTSIEFGEYGILLYLTQNRTSLLEPFGRGIYNLDIIDPFGHPQLRLKGVISLEEGTKHG